MGTDIVKYEPQTTAMPHIKKEQKSGRLPFLDDPEMVELFARAVSDGWTNKLLCSTFHISERSCQGYKKDPRVKHAAVKYTQERILLITRKTDTEIERRLNNADELDVADLIKLRKEYLGGAFRVQAEGRADDRTVNEAMNTLEGNPELAAELLKLLGGKAPKVAV